jgi:protein-disulfide isomerase
MELNFYKQTGRDAMGPIVEDLTPPVDLDRDHWRGGERAAVTLVEYGDYECPYSRMAFRTIQRLEQQLAGQLRFVFRQLPLTGIHPHALAAAHFAEAAALQGRFWPMHELLFSPSACPGGLRPPGLCPRSRQSAGVSGSWL